MAEQTPQVTEELEEREARERAEQPPLFEVGRGGRFQPGVAAPPALAIDSTLQVAIHWYRRHLEQGGHTRNTIESYCYDLAVVEKLIGYGIMPLISLSIVLFLMGPLRPDPRFQPREETGN